MEVAAAEEETLPPVVEETVPVEVEVPMTDAGANPWGCGVCGDHTGDQANVGSCEIWFGSQYPSRSGGTQDGLAFITISRAGGMLHVNSFREMVAKPNTIQNISKDPWLVSAERLHHDFSHEHPPLIS